MRSYFTNLHFSFTVIILLFMALIGCKQESLDITRETYTRDIQNYLSSIKGTGGSGIGYTDSILREIDFGRVKKIKWKNCDLIIAPFKGNTNKRLVNLTLEVEEDRITSGNLFEIVATGSGDNAANQFENFLQSKPYNFSGSFKVSNVRKGNCHELLTYRFSNGKITQAEFVRPDIKKRNLAKERPTPTGLISSLDDPTENCVTWVRVYYNPLSGEIYNVQFLYTICEGGSGGGGGNGPSTSYEYQDPCAKAQALKDSTFKDKLGLLKYAALHTNYESLWVNSIQAGASTWNLYNGNPNEHTVHVPWGNFPVASLNSIMHNHFEGGSSFFSEDDIKALYGVLKNNLMADPNSFTFSIITKQETTYTLMIEDIALFMAFGDAWFANATSFNNFKAQYQGLYGIDASNSASDNKTGFLKMLQATNAGLTLFTGNFNTLNSWKPSVKNSSNEYITIPCN